MRFFSTANILNPDLFLLSASIESRSLCTHMGNSNIHIYFVFFFVRFVSFRCSKCPSTEFIENYTIGKWHVCVSLVNTMIFCHVYFMVSNIKSAWLFHVVPVFAIVMPSDPVCIDLCVCMCVLCANDTALMPPHFWCVLRGCKWLQWIFVKTVKSKIDGTRLCVHFE